MTFQHRVEYLAFRLMRAKWGVLPERWASLSGELTGSLAGGVLKVRRAEVDANLRRAFPDESDRWLTRVAMESYEHLGREASTLFRMSKWSREDVLQRVRFEEFEMVDEAVAAGAGAILMTAHLGNWELAGAALAARGYPIDVVQKGMSNRAFEDEIKRMRAGRGMGLIDLEDATRGVVRSLDRGRVPALLGDQNAHRGGVFVPFFGVDAATHRGLAVLALRKEVPVFVGFAIRDFGGGRTYTLRAHRLDSPRTGDLDEDVRALLLEYHGILEEAIRGAPEQYFWHHRRWKTRPPEEPRA